MIRWFSEFRSIAVALARQAWLHSLDCVMAAGATERSTALKPCRRQEPLAVSVKK